MEKRKGGRSPGRSVHAVSYALPAQLIQAINAYAVSKGISRSQAVGQLLASSRRLRATTTI